MPTLLEQVKQLGPPSSACTNKDFPKPTRDWKLYPFVLNLIKVARHSLVNRHVYLHRELEEEARKLVIAYSDEDLADVFLRGVTGAGARVLEIAQHNLQPNVEPVAIPANLPRIPLNLKKDGVYAGVFEHVKKVAYAFYGGESFGRRNDPFRIAVATLRKVLLEAGYAAAAVEECVARGHFDGMLARIVNEHCNPGFRRYATKKGRVNMYHLWDRNPKFEFLAFLPIYISPDAKSNEDKSGLFGINCLAEYVTIMLLGSWKNKDFESQRPSILVKLGIEPKQLPARGGIPLNTLIGLEHVASRDFRSPYLLDGAYLKMDKAKIKEGRRVLFGGQYSVFTDCDIPLPGGIDGASTRLLRVQVTFEVEAAKKRFYALPEDERLGPFVTVLPIASAAPGAQNDALAVPPEQGVVVFIQGADVDKQSRLFCIGLGSDSDLDTDLTVRTTYVRVHAHCFHRFFDLVNELVKEREADKLVEEEERIRELGDGETSAEGVEDEFMQGVEEEPRRMSSESGPSEGKIDLESDEDMVEHGVGSVKGEIDFESEEEMVEHGVGSVKRVKRVKDADETVQAAEAGKGAKRGNGKNGEERAKGGKGAENGKVVIDLTADDEDDEASREGVQSGKGKKRDSVASGKQVVIDLMSDEDDEPEGAGILAPTLEDDDEEL